jgi:hypothetical protein
MDPSPCLNFSLYTRQFPIVSTFHCTQDNFQCIIFPSLRFFLCSLLINLQVYQTNDKENLQESSWAIILNHKIILLSFCFEVWTVKNGTPSARRYVHCRLWLSFLYKLYSKAFRGLRKIIKSCVMMWVQRVLWEVWGGYLSFPFIEFSDLSEFGRGDFKIAIYWHI